MTHKPHCASLLNPPDPHPSSKTNKNHHQSTTLLPKSTQNPTTQKTHLPNPSTHSNLPVKPTKNHPKSNQITKPRLSSTIGRDGRSTKAEIELHPRPRSALHPKPRSTLHTRLRSELQQKREGWRKWEKRERKKGKREKEVVKKEKKKKTLKKAG